jgi:predicted ATPase
VQGRKVKMKRHNEKVPSQDFEGKGKEQRKRGDYINKATEAEIVMCRRTPRSFCLCKVNTELCFVTS